MPDLNEHLQSRLIGIQASLNAHHLGGVGMPSATKGSERENFLRDFLQQVYPSHYRFSRGAITDSEGKRSGQIDIALENPVLPSFPLPGSSGDRLILAEAVAAVIEVKSDLSSQWSQVEDTCQSLKRLVRNAHSGQVRYGAFMGVPPKITTIPLIAVGYTGYKTEESLAARISKTEFHSRPDIAIVLDSGAFWSPTGSACGVLGLYALCISISDFMASCIVSNDDLSSYVKNKT